ncbi:MAG: agmatine deiminase family protein [Methylococcaceae bacterium]|jgi:agmatine/peptidylarginine deiminase
MIRFPAEWEKQAAVLIAWPHHTGDFGQGLDAVEQSYSVIAHSIRRYQRLIIVCRDDAHQNHIQNLLVSTDNIKFIQAMTNDIWVRDTAFLSIEEDGFSRLLNFKFNGWGSKYPHDADDALNSNLLKAYPFNRARYYDIDFILEGGSIESDGIGTILTTRQCLLNSNRNSALSQQDIEQRLTQYFGVSRILWLDQENLSGDDTDAHIDTLARFCLADTIAYTSCDNRKDPHYRSLKMMEEQLLAFKTPSGDNYHLTALPLPEALFDENGQRLPANYANFLLINGACLVPVYEDPNDDVALERLSLCFPSHDIVPIPCRPLVHQYGSLHCMTMQFPEAALAR